MAEEEGRSLRLQAMFPAIQSIYDPAAGIWLPFAFTNNQSWHFDTVVVNAVPRPYCWSHTTIDLSKMAMEDETLFPMGITVQDPGLYVNDDTANKSMIVLDLITTKEIDPSLIVRFSGMVSLDDAQGSMYGMMGSSDDGTQIIFGQFRLMTHNNNLTQLADTLHTEWSKDFSSGEPTAVDQLHCYRIVQVPGTSSTPATLYVPAARFYLTAVIGSESDLEYLMRLKRSYELQQS